MGKELKRLLLAEDEPDIREITRIILEAEGFQVLECSNGLEALENAGGFQPDLLLMDVMMPGMDGPSAVKSLRGKPEMKDIPVIFLTARTQSREIQALQDLGYSEVITKPFDPLILPEKIREIWARMTGG